MDQLFISIHLVTWNSLKFLPFCLESLKKQTFKNFSILIIDNGSTDGIDHRISELSRIFPNNNAIHFIKNNTNLGFATAHNLGIQNLLTTHYSLTTNHYVLVLNPDVILTPNYLETLVAIMEKQPQAAGITGRLLRYELTTQYSDIVDSEGLEILKTRKVQERNGGKKIVNCKLKIENYEEVFGISGACALYRLSALEDAKIPIRINQPYQHQSAGFEYFDQDFFCYKEDIDLSWRLRLLGWKFLFTPQTIAYHYRAAKAGDRKNRKQTINYYSYRNHFLLLLKNEDLINFILHLPWIIGYELGKLLYLAFKEPKTLLGLGGACKILPDMLRKRRLIMAKRRVGLKEIRQWFH